MSRTSKKMKPMAYVKTGPTATHNGAWKHPASELGDIVMPERYEHLAKVLEAGFFDGCCFADSLGLRYARGDEVVEACCALWDCWEEGAMIMDREEGLFIDRGRVRYANSFRGTSRRRRTSGRAATARAGRAGNTTSSSSRRRSSSIR